MTQFGYNAFQQDVLEYILGAAETYDKRNTEMIKELHEVIHYILEKTLDHLEITREAYNRGKIAGISEAKRKLEEIN